MKKATAPQKKMQTTATEAETSLGERNFAQVREIILEPLKNQKIITTEEFDELNVWFCHGAKHVVFLCQKDLFLYFHAYFCSTKSSKKRRKEFSLKHLQSV